ncbi:hypothetical protein [Palleronia caenipelagi]|uniref:Uncharacterized protein n=1 Tax=Palleronia caenipelagi TaxID=2489174 RepID=A0A547QAQ1_9RHOB|nr:hypothetical protein [Palleronia caenipelagi]TRD23458.1 hypothetical protein FEV53_00120 [Palleronia caenipelagi]
MQARWEADPECGFWVDFYERMLAGGPLPEGYTELLLEIAQQDEGFWEGGDADVNARIAPLFDAWRAGQVVQGERERFLRAAFSNFSFDHQYRLMRMVPFESDLKHLRDPDRLRSFLDDAEELRDSIEDLRDALAAEGGRQGAGAAASFLSKVLAELDRAEDHQHLRVGRLVQLGRDLERIQGDEGLRRSLARRCMRGCATGLRPCQS